MMKLIKLVISVVLAMFMFVVVSECVLRVWPPRLSDFFQNSTGQESRLVDSDPKYGYRIKKSTEIAGYRHNSLGFVGPDFIEKKQDHVKRVLCVGDSNTYGSGTGASENSYPMLLQRMFDIACAGQDTRVEVINAGVFGYESGHVAAYVQNELGRYSPDVYVIMLGTNDVINSGYFAPKGQGDAGAVLEAIADIVSVSRAMFFVMGHCARFSRPFASSQLYSLVRERELRSNIRSIVLSTEKQGAAAILVVPPSNTSLDYPRLKEWLRSVDENQFHMQDQGQRILGDAIASVGKEMGVPVLDAQEMFRKEQADHPDDNPVRYWGDSIHISRYGSHVLAKGVFRMICSAGASLDLSNCLNIPNNSLDAVNVDVVDWRPPDGSGWPKENEYSYNNIEVMPWLADTEPDGSGWSYFKTVKAGEAGLMRVELPRTDTIKIYPRIQGAGDSIDVCTDSSCRERLFHFVKSDRTGAWTGVSDWYIVKTGGRKSVYIRLTGENAQLWHKKDAVCFSISSGG